MRGTLVRNIGISAIIALSLTACGQSPGSSSATQTVSIPSDFQSYVSEFQSLAQQNGQTIEINNLIVQFGGMSSSSERGECDLSGAVPTITIDQSYWDSADDNTRKTLIFHEMGHCVLRREHRTGISSGGYPLSLMNAYTVSGSVYNAETAYYNAELFTHENQF